HSGTPVSVTGADASYMPCWPGVSCIGGSMHSSYPRYGFFSSVRATVALVLLAGTLALLVGAVPAWAREGADAKVFDEAARLVRDNFYDPKLRGMDWDATIARHRPRYLTATDPKGRSEAINGLLAELDAS